MTIPRDYLLTRLNIEEIKIKYVKIMYPLPRINFQKQMDFRRAIAKDFYMLLPEGNFFPRERKLLLNMKNTIF